ncbi:hypothetical protein BC941DRAFT_477215 [Chlamydoabsidia padenii]|nr:hypothetical protein BC941DRAFT_477215 [Chlamydoabsidia padenii]
MSNIVELIVYHHLQRYPSNDLGTIIPPGLNRSNSDRRLYVSGDGIKVLWSEGSKNIDHDTVNINIINKNSNNNNRTCRTGRFVYVSFITSRVTHVNAYVCEYITVYSMSLGISGETKQHSAMKTEDNQSIKSLVKADQYKDGVFSEYLDMVAVKTLCESRQVQLDHKIIITSSGMVRLQVNNSTSTSFARVLIR